MHIAQAEKRPSTWNPRLPQVMTDCRHSQFVPTNGLFTDCHDTFGSSALLWSLRRPEFLKFGAGRVRTNVNIGSIAERAIEIEVV